MEVPLPDRAVTYKNVSIKSTTTEYMYNKENLSKIRKMNSLAPEVMKPFWDLHNAAARATQGILLPEGSRASTPVNADTRNGAFVPASSRNRPALYDSQMSHVRI
jgi:hypothetical protein